MPKTFPLPDPITVVGDNDTQEVKEITLRDPTRQDFRACGETPDVVYAINYPDGGQRFVVDYKLIRRYTERLVDKTQMISLDDITDLSVWQEIGVWLGEKLPNLKN